MDCVCDGVARRSVVSDLPAYPDNALAENLSRACPLEFDRGYRRGMTDTNTPEDQTYTATLVGAGASETVELTFINGSPQKSFVRPTEGETGAESEEVVWELDADAEGEGFVYRAAGLPGADYS
jgi:hypothetical protein